VSRALAARLLGISQTALDRHVATGGVAVVRTPRGRVEVPVSEVVGLAVEQRRAPVGQRPLGRALRRRRQRADELQFEFLFPDRPETTGPHRRAELLALAYHRAVARRLDPRIVADARRRLRRWEAQERIHPRAAATWREVLTASLPDLAEAIARDAPDAAELRQASPFAGALSELERARIAELVRSLH
jgi:hypothetical protein